MEELTKLDKTISDKISEQHSILTELLISLGPLEKIDIDFATFRELTLKEEIKTVFD